MDVQPVTLEGEIVRLEPLAERHSASLARHGEPAFFRYSSTGPSALDAAGYDAYVRRTLATPASLPFAVVLRGSGEAVGVTTYMDIRPEHRGLEIGSTWIGRAQQGTRVNPEMKCLMLRHAFETLGAVRVQLKTDARNEHSQRAIARLGAMREGVLRRHIVLPDGYVRDTVMYSITDAEWPAVKEGLEARLAGLGSA